MIEHDSLIEHERKKQPYTMRHAIETYIEAEAVFVVLDQMRRE